MFGRTLTLICAAAVLTGAAGCNATGENPAVPDSDGPDARELTDVGRREGSAEQAPDVAQSAEAARDSGDTAADAGDPAEAACEDPRRFGDNKSADDRCWDPPTHYCAQGGNTAITRGCSPDGAFCCEYSTSCIPCGFIDCSPCDSLDGGGEACPAACQGEQEVDNTHARCRQPDLTLEICF